MRYPKEPFGRQVSPSSVHGTNSKSIIKRRRHWDCPLVKHYPGPWAQLPWLHQAQQLPQQ